MKIYVASSWRNTDQPAVVDALREVGHEVYDFRHPQADNDGFHWSTVMPSYRRVVTCATAMPPADVAEYIVALHHPIAEAGFANDFDAMRWADACLLVLPCGRSAHLELGWFAGQGKPTAIMLDGPSVTPELMYKLADVVVPGIASALEWAANFPVRT